MLSREDVLKSLPNPPYGRESCELMEPRDFYRLAHFLPVEDWKLLGLQLKEGVDPPEPREWSEAEILGCLEGDLKFAFEKALNKRGLSSGLMYNVVQMWLWILEDDLYQSEVYAQYGLPLYKAVALKYGFSNPIGDDRGDEFKYSSGGGGELMVAIGPRVRVFVRAFGTEMTVAHLVGDDPEELHRAAESLGLKREWAQNCQPGNGGFPHYDLLGEGVIQRAISQGICGVEPREQILLSKKCRGVLDLGVGESG